MPLCKQPKTLSDLCVDCAVSSIDTIFRYEEQMDLEGRATQIRFQELPNPGFQLLSDRIIGSGSAIFNECYHKILSSRSRHILLKKHSCGITNGAEFLEFVRCHCKNVVKIDIVPIIDCFEGDIESKSKAIAETLGSMVHLEWIDLEFAKTTHQFVQEIRLNCLKLRYLNLSHCYKLTDEGVAGFCQISAIPYYTLTHLNVRNTAGYGRHGYLSPYVVSAFLLHCPNLERLDYELIDKAISIAIDSYSTTASTGLAPFCDRSVGDVCEISGSPPSYGPPIEAAPFFQNVGKYCPNLEEMSIFCSTIAFSDLDHISHLPLRALTLEAICSDGDINFTPLSYDLLLLLRSVSSSLTTLELNYQSLFDLRVISRECPSLTSLTLVKCYTSNWGCLWPAYGVEDMGEATFNSLTNLDLDSTLISNSNFVALLSSPNLETLSICEDWPEEDLGKEPAVNVIPQVLQRSSEAFRKLKSVHFQFMLMFQPELCALLDRAVVLNKLALNGCFISQDGEGYYECFREWQFFDDLILNKNWDLEIEWEYCDAQWMMR